MSYLPPPPILSLESNARRLKCPQPNCGETFFNYLLFRRHQKEAHQLVQQQQQQPESTEELASRDVVDSCTTSNASSTPPNSPPNVNSDGQSTASSSSATYLSSSSDTSSTTSSSLFFGASTSNSFSSLNQSCDQPPPAFFNLPPSVDEPEYAEYPHDAEAITRFSVCGSRHLSELGRLLLSKPARRLGSEVRRPPRAKKLKVSESIEKWIQDKAPKEEAE